MGEPKRIGILTSGGDCAGLNAVIRAVVNRAVGEYGWEVLGIKSATMGLLNRPPLAMPLKLPEVDSLLTRGGTILGTTNKGDPFAFPMSDGTLKDRSEEIIAGYHQLGLDALIGIGGDGSLAILRRLAQQGNIKLIGIPKTIDNDVGHTELSIGFSTAVDIATEALDRLHFTAASHDRVMVLEVMGRDAGHIALRAGVAGGAHVILIPEIPYHLDKVCQKIRDRQDAGLNFSIVVVSEAVCTAEGQTLQKLQQFGECRLGGIGQYVADSISKCTGAETRVTVLGHIQRGGRPSAMDRILASAFGIAAVDLIYHGKDDLMVTWRDSQVINIPIAEAIKDYRTVNHQDTLVTTARGLGICLGN